LEVAEVPVESDPRPTIVKVDAPEFKSKRRKTICLCMIVKNEAPVIRDCLESVRSIIDHWVIADTGSTDGTQDIILETFKDIPGELHQRPWVDFAFNRSEVLTLARAHGDYSFIIDADDRLEIMPGSRLPLLKADSCEVEIRNMDRRYWRTQLVNNSLLWRYEGVLHEFLSCDPDGSGKRARPEDRTQKRLLGLKIIMGQGGARRRSAAAERFSRDAELILRALETETDPFLVSRYTFYLAQSYQDSGNPKDALSCYLKRSEMGFWDQEIHVSLYRAAGLMAELNYEEKDVIDAYVRAQKIDKARAEAFHGAARHCRVNKQFEEGYRFAKAALKLAPPDHALFVEQRIYDYALLDEYAVCAYWLGKYDECLRACRQLLREQKMPESMIERVKANAQFAQEKLASAD
jgi:glycosyltransferase involved in cell wall biosynthesis